MPTFDVKSPDGGTYRVNAPDGSTEQDALAYVKKNQSTLQALPITAPKQDKTESTEYPALKPIADIPKDIWEDVKSGAAKVGEGAQQSWEEHGSLVGGLKGLAGAAQVAGAPFTGAAKALIGDPLRATGSTDSSTIGGFVRGAANPPSDVALVFVSASCVFSAVMGCAT